MSQPQPETTRAPAGRTPIWRDRRALRLLAQILFLALVAAGALWFIHNMFIGLRQLGLNLSFDFWRQRAGFAIGEGIRYSLDDTYGRAFWVGVVNTVRISACGLVFASVIGVVVGVARLSRNALVRQLAFAYVECFRNVPLLLQLLFWYSAVFLQLPSVRRSPELFHALYVNNRGGYLPTLRATGDTRIWLYGLLFALVAGIVAWWWRRGRLARADRPGFPLLWGLMAFVAVAALAWPLAGHPLRLELPVLKGFNFKGGLHLTPEFAALLLGLSSYTGAFIAEIVRAGIQAVGKGQREAALALGLRPGAVMVLVVLPQALRIIIPPVTSQWLNLIKNSSLAIAIGYPDLFNVGGTILNQTGQSIIVFAMMMAVYLALSLLASTAMNRYNRRVRLVER